MIFLVEYDRDNGRLVSLNKFDDLDRSKAEDSRIELEVALNKQGVSREIVLLQAETEQALRQTHRRYFEKLSDLIRSPATSQ